ncbi:hypothetical protein TeGR_g856, partial [Tetraparma gracilis]
TTSHCLIKLSQRGEFVPGTENRIITIVGSRWDDVNNCIFMIQDKINMAMRGGRGGADGANT